MEGREGTNVFHICANLRMALRTLVNLHPKGESREVPSAEGLQVWPRFEAKGAIFRGASM